MRSRPTHVGRDLRFGICAAQIGILLAAGCSGGGEAGGGGGSKPSNSGLAGSNSSGGTGWNPTGSAGTTSSSGSAGTSGQAGSGDSGPGAAGSSSVGSAGSSGTGGTIGAAGSGSTGRGGSSGMAGSSGAAGKGGSGGGSTTTGTGGTPVSVGGKPAGKVWNTAVPSTMVGVPKTSWQMDLISPTMNNHHHVNQAMIVNGYLFVGGNEEFWLYDVSDPKAPKQVSFFSPPTAHVSKEAESHCLSAMRSGDNIYLVTTSGTGADLWDATNPATVKFLSHVTTPNTNYGDYTEAVWGLSWVGQYLYIGATNNGVSIVDTTDVMNPKIVTQIATSSVGGVNTGPVDVVGNILIAMTPKNNSGIATIDVSDPLKPAKLSAFTTKTNSYITQFYRHYAVEIGPMRVWDVLTNPKSVSTTPMYSLNNEYAEYISFADDNIFVGHARTSIGTAPGATKYDISNITSWKQVNRIWGRLDDGGINDDQFTLAFGNILYIGDDQEPYYGWVLGVHQAEPDTKAPVIDTVIPRDATTGVSLKTAIGVSLTDNIELASLNQASFYLHEMGSSTPMPGRYGVRMGVINFDPDGDLKPNTTYEVVLTRGGVADYVGNTLATEWKSTFTTGN